MLVVLDQAAWLIKRGFTHSLKQDLPFSQGLNEFNDSIVKCAKTKPDFAVSALFYLWYFAVSTLAGAAADLASQIENNYGSSNSTQAIINAGSGIQHAATTSLRGFIIFALFSVYIMPAFHIYYWVVVNSHRKNLRDEGRAIGVA